MNDLNFKIFSNRFGFYAIPEAYQNLFIPKQLEQGLVYEPRTIEFICNHAGDGDVVSGGAFIGDFLPAISRSLAQGAQLHSFEPHPISFAAASKTIEVNRLRNTELHQIAVGEKPGRVALTLTNADRGGEIAGGTARVDPERSGTESGFAEVGLTTLDHLIPKERQVSVLHLDLEGFERAALRGAVQMVTRSKPIIILETRKIEADWLNSIFPGCNYVATSFYEKNTFYLPLP